MIRSSLESKIYIILQGSDQILVTRRFSKTAWAVILVAILVIAAVIYRMWGASFQWQLFVDTFARIRLGWLAVSILLILLTYVTRALRWEIMLRPLGKRVSLRRLTYDTTIGFMAVVLLGRAGEAVRPYLIAVSAGVPFSSQMAAWLLERILDLLMVLLLFGFALTLIPSHGLALGPSLKWVLEVGGYIVTAMGVGAVLFLLLFRNFSGVAQRRILSALTFLPRNHFDRAERMLTAFSKGMESTRDLSSLGLLGGYTLLTWAVIVASYFTLFQCFAVTSQLKLTDVVVFLGFMAFGSAVQIPGIGGGMQVTSIIVLTQIYGLSVESATGVALFLWVITVVVVVPVGLLCALHEGLNWSKIKQLSKSDLSEEPIP
jgi:uncharacterized protein (TIRG00374 family)